MYEFRLRFHWNLFPKIQLTIGQHWFRLWLGAKQATSHYLKQCWPSSLMHTCSTRGRWVNDKLLIHNIYQGWPVFANRGGPPACDWQPWSRTSNFDVNLCSISYWLLFFIINTTWNKTILSYNFFQYEWRNSWNVDDDPREYLINAYELLNLTVFKPPPHPTPPTLNKIHIFQCMGIIFCVEFQRVSLKVHTKYLTHTLTDAIFIYFKSS